MLKWIVSGATDLEIRQAIEAEWPDAASRPLIAQAYADIEKLANADPDTIRGWAFLASRELYRKMVDIGDFTGALRAVKQISEMVG